MLIIQYPARELLFLRQRQSHDKPRTLTIVGIKFYRPPMRGNHRTHHRQPQTGTAGTRGEEGFENLFLQAMRDTLAANGGWYVPNQLMLLPPSAFFIIGFLIWAIRAWKPAQVEETEFKEVRVRPAVSEPVLDNRSAQCAISAVFPQPDGP